MKIGIIGAGFIARAVGKLAVQADHQVMLSNSRGPRTLGSTAISVGAAIGTVRDACAFGDILLLAIPFYAYDTLPADALAGRIVMDAGNYYPQRDEPIVALDKREATTSGMLQALAPEARIVKAWNAILERDIEKDARPAGSPDRRALPIAGDDADAKAAVAGLIDELGYDVVDGGTLAESWRFERGKPCYCIPLNKADLTRALAAAERDVDAPTGSWR